MKVKFSVLARSPFFRGLDEGEIEALLRDFQYRHRLFPAGSVVALSGDRITSVMIVLAGSLSGEMLDLSGRVVKIEDIKPPQALASAFIYGNGARYPVNVTAKMATELLVMGNGDFMQMMQRDARVLSNYLEVVCSKALFLSDRIRFLSLNTIREKAANYLLSLPVSNDQTVRPDKSRQQLAEYFGVARPSLSRVLGEMEEEGLISVRKNEIRIIDMKKLESLIR